MNCTSSPPEYPAFPSCGTTTVGAGGASGLPRCRHDYRKVLIIRGGGSLKCMLKEGGGPIIRSFYKSDVVSAHPGS